MNNASRIEPGAIIAGFWRRLAAFLVDVLLLGAMGYVAGIFLFDVFARLGLWGRVLGFCIALTYFGFLNSRFGQGQTLGKRLLGICVVDKSGRPLSLFSSVARCVPLCLPWFLNKAQLPPGLNFSPIWNHIVTLAIFGLGFTLLYLYVFNITTRQSLHDVLVGSFVVTATSAGSRVLSRLPRLHLWISVLLLVVAGAGPLFFQEPSKNPLMLGLLRVQQQAIGLPWVAHADVQQGTFFAHQPGGKSTTFLRITAHMNDANIHDKSRAKQLAKTALETDSSVQHLSSLQVVLAHGYDIGIASFWRSRQYVHTPPEWQQP